MYAVHPFTGAGVPVYVADYVLSDYGSRTKAVMGKEYLQCIDIHMYVYMCTLYGNIIVHLHSLELVFQYALYVHTCTCMWQINVHTYVLSEYDV